MSPINRSERLELCSWFWLSLFVGLVQRICWIHSGSAEYIDALNCLFSLSVLHIAALIKRTLHFWKNMTQMYTGWNPFFSAREQLQEHLWTSWSFLGCMVENRNNFYITYVNVQFLYKNVHYVLLKKIQFTVETHYTYTVETVCIRIYIYGIVIDL